MKSEQGWPRAGSAKLTAVLQGPVRVGQAGQGAVKGVPMRRQVRGDVKVHGRWFLRAAALIVCDDELGAAKHSTSPRSPPGVSPVPIAPPELPGAVAPTSLQINR